MPGMVLLNQNGPLPLKATFQSPTAGGAVVFVLSGSAWSTTANTMIGVDLLLDGQKIGTAQIFSNGTSEHRALITEFVPANLAFGSHSISLAPSTSTTVTDTNDSFNVMLLY